MTGDQEHKHKMVKVKTGLWLCECLMSDEELLLANLEKENGESI